MTNTPIDPLVIIELTNLKASGKLEELASHPQLAMKPEWMAELVENKDWSVRYNLASNPAIANYPGIIQTLASDEDPAVRISLASNPALAQNPAIANYPDVRYWLARNLAIPTSTASNATPWQTAQQATQAPTI
ncbi:hypothetical protein [Ferrimicrobium acidiphilum]|uniref:hypothetical protein n=1 Tax=Ferrimicrobium acidiphilum TaxID=121039 RepID=UPI0023F3B4C2|nr:hypothetical protein [Ferrimicrobium acidiphilum]